MLKVVRWSLMDGNIKDEQVVDRRFSEEYYQEAYDAVVRECKEKGYCFSGEDHFTHRYGVPVFNDGMFFAEDMYVWANLMAEVMGEKDYRKYYMNDYVDEDRIVHPEPEDWGGLVIPEEEEVAVIRWNIRTLEETKRYFPQKVTKDTETKLLEFKKRLKEIQLAFEEKEASLKEEQFEWDFVKMDEGAFITDFHGKSIHVEPLEDCFEMIRARLSRYQERNHYLNQENKRLKDEHYKDEEIKRLKEENDRIRRDLIRGFPITEEDQERIDQWKLNHEITVHHRDTEEKRLAAAGAVGGKWSYEFHPTSVWMFRSCVCNQCRDKAFKESRGNLERYNQLMKKYDAEVRFDDE